MRVLVVDDGADIRFLIASVLQLNGHEADQASGGAEALALLARDAPAGLPSVVVLDVQMPGMDGWATLRAIRSNPRTANIPVVLCSVKGRPEDVALGWELGCDGYLNKPFGIDELRDEVAAVARRGRAERLSVRESAFHEARRRLGDPVDDVGDPDDPALADTARPEARAR
ncbi:MAG: response regulator transcription factor [Actinomycetota bacterium]